MVVYTTENMTTFFIIFNYILYTKIFIYAELNMVLTFRTIEFNFI